MHNKDEISITQLARQTGLSKSYLVQMVKRGILPPGEKRGRVRWLPYSEAMAALGNQDYNKRWPRPYDAQPRLLHSKWTDLI